MGVCLPGRHAPKSPLLNLSRQDEFVLNVVKLPSCCSAAPQAGSLPPARSLPRPYEHKHFSAALPHTGRSLTACWYSFSRIPSHKARNAFEIIRGRLLRQFLRV